MKKHHQNNELSDEKPIDSKYHKLPHSETNSESETIFRKIHESFLNDLKNKKFFKQKVVSDCIKKTELNENLCAHITHLFNYYCLNNKQNIIENIDSLLIKRETSTESGDKSHIANSNRKFRDSIIRISVPNDEKEVVNLSPDEAAMFFSDLDSFINGNQSLSDSVKPKHKCSSSDLI